MSLWRKISKLLHQPEDAPPAPVNPHERLTRPGIETTEAAPPPAVELDICLQSDTGLVRTNNEDRGVYQIPADPRLAASKGTLVVVADGMGGASAGEVASEMAVRIIPETYYASASLPPPLALRLALETANREIFQKSQSDPQFAGMGTTCVAMAVIPPDVYVAYVGDSRLYLLRDSEFHQLTEDHTVVFEMVRQGLLTREQARSHEERNVLLMSIGARPQLDVSYWEKPMITVAGDRWLLCSDGLHDVVGEAEMREIVSSAAPQDAIPKLIEAAKRQGGNDNITAALVHVFAPDPQALEPDTRTTREFKVSAR
jgi:PPM family protein phosphatase